MVIHRKVEGIKPCPFCGSTNVMIHTKEFIDRVISVRKERKEDCEGFAFEIVCKDCHTEMTDFTDSNVYDYEEISRKLINRWCTRRRVKR